MRRTLSSEQPTVPISQFRVARHKMGYKPVIACSCDETLDLNTATPRERKAFFAEHALCPPKADRSALVAQIAQE